MKNGVIDAGMFNPPWNSPFSYSEGFTHFNLVNLRFVSFWSQNSNPHGNSPFNRSEGFILVAKHQNFFSSSRYLAKLGKPSVKKIAPN